jgi:hypothetical protein
MSQLCVHIPSIHMEMRGTFSVSAFNDSAAVNSI